MINTIIQGRMLVFVQQVNVLLYYVRKLPLVGEKIPYRLYVRFTYIHIGHIM